MSQTTVENSQPGPNLAGPLAGSSGTVTLTSTTAIHLQQGGHSLSLDGREWMAAWAWALPLHHIPPECRTGPEQGSANFFYKTVTILEFADHMVPVTSTQLLSL